LKTIANVRAIVIVEMIATAQLITNAMKTALVVMNVNVATIAIVVKNANAMIKQII